ncbi:MAG: hypothetical protein ACFB03_06045 [Paracoccaceae bacterium]
MTRALLIGGMVVNINLHLIELPVVGLSRTQTVVARTRELQDLPSAVDLSKHILTEQIAAYVGEIGTHCLGRQ